MAGKRIGRHVCVTSMSIVPFPLLARGFRAFFWGDLISVSLTSVSASFCFLFPMTLGSAPSNTFFAAARSLACLALAFLATISGLLTIHILAANETMNHVPVPSIGRQCFFKPEGISAMVWQIIWLTDSFADWPGSSEEAIVL